MKKSVLLIIICHFAIKGYSQSQKGERTLTWQIDLAENNNIIVHCLQGMKNEKIAEVMLISINTVKLYKKAAYQNLRRIIYL